VTIVKAFVVDAEVDKDEGDEDIKAGKVLREEVCGMLLTLSITPNQKGMIVSVVHR
jgi:hypothetical protein